MTRPAQVTVNSLEQSMRIVGDSREILRWARAQSNLRDPITNEITFWDEDHGIQVGQSIRIESKRAATDFFTDKIGGYVLEVKGSEISILGDHITVIGARSSSREPASTSSDGSLDGHNSNGKLRYSWAADLGPFKPGR